MLGHFQRERVWCERLPGKDLKDTAEPPPDNKGGRVLRALNGKSDCLKILTKQ